MIPHVSIVNVWVLDQDVARSFYVDKLGFVEISDTTTDSGYRWLSVAHPDHRDLQLLLMRPGPPLEGDDITAITDMLRRSVLSPVVLAAADCYASYERLRGLGVDFIQEPTEQPYGIEAVLRDPCGNWLALIERREHGTVAEWLE